jgi:predicted glycosyltransferase
MSAGTAEIVVSRAGSTIFEIAAWGLPSIIIPLPNTISHDQTANAFAYAKSGAAVVIEENNLSSHVLIEEIDRIVLPCYISLVFITGVEQYHKFFFSLLILLRIIESVKTEIIIN